MSAPDRRLDCLGLFCPVPIVRAAEAVRGMTAGQVLELLGDDPGLRADLPAWCRSTGHALLSLEESGGVLTGRIEKRIREARG